MDTNKPIANVSAYNKKQEKHAISNINGVLDISNYTDNETIFLQHLSYQNLQIKKTNLLIKKTVFLKSKNNNLEEVYISVSKKEVKRSRIAQELATVTKAEIVKLSPQTSADMLANIAGVKVQKSQFGGGSPVLRGMEANRILLVVDGVRMNNAIYRKGHLQNSISISPNMLERTEIVFGPSSVMYGSDALGGVIHYITKKPKTAKTTQFKKTFLTRYNTINNEFTQQIGLEIQAKKIATYTNFSYSKFGDLKMGKNRTHGFENWGLQPIYSNNTEDYYNEFPVNNPNPEIQKNVGFSQFDLLQKIYIPLNNKTNLNFNLQYSKSSDIHRFDSLTEYLDGTLKFAEWYYGPQTRFLFSTQLNLNINKKWIKNGTITAAFQDIKESRIQRQFSSLNRSYRNENVKIFSINADFEVPISKKNNRLLSYGTEFTHNKVKSNAYGKTLEINGNDITGFSNNFTVQSRYPDGGSSYVSTAIYTNYRQDISKRETLNTGIRLTNTYLKAKWNNETFITLPNNNIKLSNSALTATVGYVFRPTKKWQINGVLSSGFRSPNIDDIGKVREKRGIVTVPNIYLKPEYVYSSEISVLKYLKNKKHHLGFSAYYTLLKDYITRDIFSLNGNNTIIYDGEEVTTIANVNKGNAYVIGSTITYKIDLTKNFYNQAQITYTKGSTYDTNEPLSSIPPTFGSVQIGFSKNKINTSLSYRFNGKKRLEDYNIPEGIDNIEETPYIEETNSYYGNPAWQTFSYDLKYNINKNFQFIFRIDNILDAHYKEFASAISAPGRSFGFTIVGSF